MKAKEVSESAHAYTPGLKMKRAIRVRKVRRLPVPGEVLVDRGDTVSFGTVVARTHVPGDPHVLRAAYAIGVEPEDFPGYVLKKVGDPVEEGEPLARNRMLFGLINKVCPSPVKGRVETVSELTGQLIVRGDPVPVEVTAYIPGKVVDVLPREGVVVETEAAFIQGIFGIGGETHGEIDVLVDSAEGVLEADMMGGDCEGKILVGGSLVTKSALYKAVEVGASGIVAGGIGDEDLIEFVGYDIGVAITGHEEVGLSVIITEGFGKMNMSKSAFGLLKEFDGREASISGATQIRAGVMRPEVIIPHGEESPSSEADVELAGGIKAGTCIRVIREPYFGLLGEVVSLPVELEQIETESRVRVVEVQLDDGRRVIVPRANVEIIEE